MSGPSRVSRGASHREGAPCAPPTRPGGGGTLGARAGAALQGRARPSPAINRTQAEVPEGAAVLPNPRGTAPGLWVEDTRGRVVVLLPGVPREKIGRAA